MVDITSKLFWCRSKEWYRIMADKLTEIVYTDDSKETIDVINLLLLGWILLGLIVYIIGNVIATYLRKRKSILPILTPETADDKSETSDLSCFNDVQTHAEDVISEIHTISPTIPTCEGDDEVVKWINSVFSWVYTQRVVSPIIDSWLSALNARTRLSSTEHGILVDFKDLLQTSGPPRITEVRQSCSSRFDTDLTCQMECVDIAFEVVVTQFKEKDKVIIPFVLNVHRLFGKVAIDCSPEDVTFVAKYSETPQIELSSEAAKSNELSSEDYRPLCDLVCEITCDALSTAIVPLRFSCFPACPRPYSEEDVFEAADSESEKKLVVKIIKATNLGGSKGCLKPYCVVEMDEPPQRFETHVVEGTDSPFWDETFTFTVKDSAELLFEMYDKDEMSTDNFLGLGLVGVDELQRNPSQRQIIPLQSRPLQEDDVTGTLIAEFLFMNQTPLSEPTHFAPWVVKEEACPGKTVETNSRVTAGGTVITTTTIKRTKEEELEPFLHANPNALPPPNLHETEEVTPNGDHKLFTPNGNCKPELLAQHTDYKPESFTLNGDCKLESLTSNGDCKLFAPEGDYKFDLLALSSHAKILTNTLHTEEETMPHSDSTTATETNTKTDDLGNENSLKISIGNAPVIIPPRLPTIVVEEPLSNGPLITESIEIRSPTDLENPTDAEADLTGAALKELEKHSTPATSKSTLIIHSVQRPESSVSGSLEASPASHLSKDSRTSNSESVPSSPTPDRVAGDRSRPKEKKSFMGNLRRRLSFHKTRSKSAENRFESASNYSQASSRSASTDRIRHAPVQRLSPFKGKFLGSTRSSLSEASGISASSERTYTNENSTLVIETNENGIIKRYLIPNSLIHRSKWKKRGTKLHIFNDHVFLAKHLSGSTLCQVCQRHLTRRPGKQGYECRGCDLQCHKSCHIKVENYCTNSSINAMEVEYVHDPKGASPKSI